MSGGEQLRDFLSVQEVADKIVCLALKLELTGIYNISSGNPKSLRIFAEELIERENSNITLNFGYYSYPNYEPMAFWGNASKLYMDINE